MNLSDQIKIALILLMERKGKPPLLEEAITNAILIILKNNDLITEKQLEQLLFKPKGGFLLLKSTSTEGEKTPTSIINSESENRPSELEDVPNKDTNRQEEEEE